MSYLNNIIEAVQMFYDNDDGENIIKRGKHVERPCQFHIAKNLCNILKDVNYEGNRLFIDCEFNKKLSNPKMIRVRKKSEWKRVIPDIIFHDRNINNIFVIEIKKGSQINKKSYFKDDRIKLKYFLTSLNYHEAYSISNLMDKKFLIHEVLTYGYKTIFVSKQMGRWTQTPYSEKYF